MQHNLNQSKQTQTLTQKPIRKVNSRVVIMRQQYESEPSPYWLRFYNRCLAWIAALMSSYRLPQTVQMNWIRSTTEINAQMLHVYRTTLGALRACWVQLILLITLLLWNCSGLIPIIALFSSSDYNADESYQPRDYLAATMQFIPGYFACDVVWSTVIYIHPRLKMGPNMGVSRGEWRHSGPIMWLLMETCFQLEKLGSLCPKMICFLWFFQLSRPCAPF